MKLTKKLEQEVKQVYLEYWESYFTGKLRQFGSLLDDDYKLIGTSEIEIINSKPDALIWLKKSVKEIKGKSEFRNRKIKISPVNDLVLVNELADVYILVNKEWKFYARIRISTFLRQTKNKWKVIQQHGSLPDVRTGEGETVSFETLSKENLELRDAVKRRTAELENRNRELEIETALERVRAVAIAMRDSSELSGLIYKLYSELTKLDAKLERCFFMIVNPENKGITWWLAGKEGLLAENGFFVPMNQHPSHLMYLDHWKNRKKKWQYLFEGKEKKDCDRYLFSKTELVRLPEFVKMDMASVKKIHLSGSSDQFGLIVTGSPEPLPEEQQEILSRFTVAFNQAYIRFLDLKKAEAQAREAEIELSMERVRSKAMAMHDSGDILATTTVSFEELNKLGIHSIRCGIGLLSKNSMEAQVYASTKNSNGAFQTLVGTRDMNEHPSLIRQYQTWLKQENSVETMSDEELESYYNLLFFKPATNSATPQRFDKKQYGYYFPFADGLFYSWSNQPYTENEINILNRFKAIVALTFRRFLDLQKAEAQAREAQIEASLERVRSRTMGMQKSDELKDVIKVVYEQFVNLNINVDHAGFIIDYKETDDMHIWLADPQLVPSQVRIPYFDSPHWNSFIEAKQKGLDSFTNHLDFKAKNKFYRGLFKLFPIAENAKKYYLNCPGLAISTVLLENIGLYIENFSGTPYTDAENAILMRFGKVFEQAYTRFLDLKKSEFQTHQAKVETALEKVRARALAMQQPEELTEVAQVMRYEMGLLGVEELETSSIYIHEDDADQAECWYAIKDIRDPEKKLVADHFELNLHDTWVGRQMFDFYQSTEKQISIPMQGVNRKEWINYCSERSTLLDGFYGEVIPERTYHLYKFSNGTIGAATPGNISAESWDLLQRAASVFSLAYSRFRDLTQARTDLQRLKEEKQRAETALADLQTTQKQLIQAEKMASLGELTAGIAHEIQNPLNFVNNFSEINTELSEELSDAAEKGDLQEVIQLANDIRSNQEKISDHGKRADAIVKGMLQHSRSSSGVKEPTNINALADEYLRLAYHGLKAKDRSFNANLKTDFDKNISNINIIPQDIGRVLLNLINNAFYAVNEKKKQIGEGYDPEVTVSTTLDNASKNPSISQLANSLIVSVRDNGKGIPAAIKEKIFQPFFTTKPTGQGTGLGLSLSYDIIKAHGGELTVETKEGEGTEFSILLPLQP